jgi:hypothetical protein
MTKRKSFAQKLEEVASIYDIRKLTFAEALSYIREGYPSDERWLNREVELTKAKYDLGLFLMLAETKPEFKDETPFGKLIQWQDPSKKQGYHFFVTHVLYNSIE